MSLKVVDVTPNTRNQVDEVLQQAIEQKFDQVYVFGMKGKKLFIQGSKIDSNLEMIGALEACKMQIWERA